MSSIDVLISEEDVRARIRQMADTLSEKYKGKDVLLVGILNGSAFFLTALAQAMAVPVEVDFMAASSYGSGTESSGNVVITREMSRPVKGRNVIIVEDIIDTGRTLKVIADMIRDMEPASLDVVALLDKPDRRMTDFEGDLVGFKIPDVFVVGWGLDYNYKYRDLPFVGIYRE